MPRLFSRDLRDRLVAAIEAGKSRRSAARRLVVSASAAVKWMARTKSEGRALRRRMGGYRRPMLASERNWLLARIEEKPDLTIRALVIELAVAGKPSRGSPENSRTQLRKICSMNVQIAGDLRHFHSTLPNQLHRLELELPAELPSLHLRPPVPKTP